MRNLLRLGVPVEIIDSVRAIVDEADLIDVVSEAVFDDLDAVLAGESVDDVVSRRDELAAILAKVDAQAEATAPVPNEPVTAQVAMRSPEPAAGQARRTAGGSCDCRPDVFRCTPAARCGRSDREAPERLRRSRQPSFSPRSGRRPDLLGRPRRHLLPRQPPYRGAASGVDFARAVVLVPSERLLDIAKAETLQGRSAAGRALLDEVHSFMNRFGSRDWPTSELEDLAQQARRATRWWPNAWKRLLDGLAAGVPQRR